MLELSEYVSFGALGLGESAWGLLGNPSRVDQDIHRAKGVHHVGHNLLDGALVADVDLVKLDGNTSAIMKLGGRLVPQFLLHIHDRNRFDPDLTQRLRHVVAQAASATVSIIRRLYCL